MAGNKGGKVMVLVQCISPQFVLSEYVVQVDSFYSLKVMSWTKIQSEN